MTFRIFLLVFTLLPLLHAEPTGVDPHPETLRVMAYNTWYVFNKGKAEAEGKEWIASRTPDVVALQELTNIQPAKLRELAAGWNHPHTSLLKTTGFSVGLTSRLPIKVIEKRTEGMHHGYLHATIGEIHYFVVHLSPFKWEVRSREAGILLEKITPLLARNQKVIVLGDFNACSADDRKWLEQNKELLQRTAASDQKYDHQENLRDGAFDFFVMNKFFHAGLVDTSLGYLPDKASHRLSFPTGILKDGKTPPRDGKRIDFILSGKVLARHVRRSVIVREGTVNHLSDHYPVITDFDQR